MASDQAAFQVTWKWLVMGTDKNDNKSIEAFELWCYRKLLRVSWKDKGINNWVLEKIGSPFILGDTIRRGSLATLVTSCIEKKALKSRYLKGQWKDVEEEVIQKQHGQMILKWVGGSLAAALNKVEDRDGEL